MRTVHWLYLVSVALFVSGIGFVVAAGRGTPSAPVPKGPELTPVATLSQIMNTIMTPNVNPIYEAVGSKSTAAGIEEWAPKNAEEWSALAANAAALAESGNLILMGGRAVDQGDWVKMTQAFIDASKTAITAAEQQNTDAILTAGELIYKTCEDCHARYRRE